MTDLESRLRELAKIDTGPADLTGLAVGARRHAARRRRRAVLGAGTAIVVALMMVGAVAFVGRERSLPARPEPTSSRVSAAELCSRTAEEWAAQQDRPLDTQFSAAALCPAEPSSPEWADLPADPVVRGAALRYVITDNGGPPREGCHFTSPFAPFRVVLQRPSGEVVYVYRGDVCGGRYLVQSFYLALAEQELLHANASAGSDQTCDPLQTPSKPGVSGPVPDPLAVRDVAVCIHPEWVPVDVEAVPRYRPVLRWTPPPEQRAALIAGLRLSNMVTTPLSRCPWNGAALVVQVTGPGGAPVNANLFCDNPQSLPGAIRWLRLPEPSRSTLLAAKASWRVGGDGQLPPAPTPRPKEELLVGARTSPLLSNESLCERPKPAFSGDGEHLVAACGNLTFVIDLPSTEPRIVSTDADDAREAAWAADGTDVVLTHRNSLEIIAVTGNTQSSRTIALPPGWDVTSIDLDAKDHALLGGMINDRSAVMTIDLDGSHPQVVITRADVTIYCPRWSPDSTRIGYLQQNTPPTNVDFVDVGAWTMAANGSDARLVLQYGKMAFLGGTPGFDWSPHGQIAFTGGGGVVVVDPNGRLSSVSPVNGALAWRPATGP